jgi:hypothetical protein
VASRDEAVLQAAHDPETPPVIRSLILSYYHQHPEDWAREYIVPEIVTVGLVERIPEAANREGLLAEIPWGD